MPRFGSREEYERWKAARAGAEAPPRAPQPGSAPASAPASTDHDAAVWFYVAAGQRHGPVSETALLDSLRSGELPMTTLVWRHGWTAWTPAERDSNITEKLPPPLPGEASETETVAVPSAGASRPTNLAEDLDFRGGFRVLSALAISLKVLVHNAGPFLVVTLVCFFPLEFYAAWYRGDQASPFTASLLGSFVVPGVAAVFLGSLASGALAHGTVQHLRGKAPAVEECVRVALVNIGRLFAVSAHAAVIVLIVVYLAGNVLLTAVPGLVALCQLWVAVPVVMFEREGTVAAIKRCGDLIHGHRLRILGIITFLCLAASLTNELVTTRQHVFDWTDLEYPQALTLAQSLAWNCVTAVVAAVSYVLLRREKADWGAEGIARVFE